MRVRTTRLEKKWVWAPMYGAGETLSIFAEILDGEFAGQEATLNNLSDFAPDRVDDLIVYQPYCVVFCDFETRR